MKHVKIACVLAIFVFPCVLGCGTGDPTPVADGDDIAAYVAAHPDSGADIEVEGGDP